MEVLDDESLIGDIDILYCPLPLITFYLISMALFLYIIHIYALYIHILTYVDIYTCMISFDLYITPDI